MEKEPAQQVQPCAILTCAKRLGSCSEEQVLNPWTGDSCMSPAHLQCKDDCIMYAVTEAEGCWLPPIPETGWALFLLSKSFIL